MKVEIEDYADVLATLTALRQYTLQLQPGSEQEPDRDRRLRVFRNITHAHDALFAIHWDLSKLGAEAGRQPTT